MTNLTGGVPAAPGLLAGRRRLTLALVAFFTLGYFAATSSLASLKPFSFDELTTVNIARLSTPGDVWRAWFESGDGVPPVVHLATHAVGAVLGFTHVTARAPDMVGFWVMCLGIYVFLGRRVCPLLAGMGMLLPITVPLAYSYAYEARGYGMVLGWASTAIVCWDLARAPRWGWAARVGLPIALAAAIATHLYAALVVVPLALGELARTREHRRPDWTVWLALIGVSALLLPANPVLSHIRRLPEVARYAAGRRVSISELAELWPQFLSLSITYLGLLALVCLLGGRAIAIGDSPSPAGGRGRGRIADWALIAGLVALPALGWVLANMATGLLLPRYVLAAVIGFSLGVPLLCHIALGHRPRAALLLAGWVAIAAAGTALTARHAMRTTSLTTEHIAAGRACFRLLNLWSSLPADGLPIVVSDFDVFNQLHHYAPESLRQRLVFVVDDRFGALIAPYTPFYARVFGQRRERLEDFLRVHPAFYLYDCGGRGRLPLVTMLLERGASVGDSGLGANHDVLLRRDLYRVSPSTGSAAR